MLSQLSRRVAFTARQGGACVYFVLMVSTCLHHLHCLICTDCCSWAHRFVTSSLNEHSISKSIIRLSPKPRHRHLLWCARLSAQGLVRIYHGHSSRGQTHHRCKRGHCLWIGFWLPPRDRFTLHINCIK